MSYILDQLFARKIISTTAEVPYSLTAEVLLSANLYVMVGKQDRHFNPSELITC